MFEVAFWIIATAVVISAALKFREAHQTARRPPPVAERFFKGGIAIVIDDWGYNDLYCSFLSDIDVPVAVSILPDLAYSRRVAQCAGLAGKEVLLHLPLEPHTVNDHYPEDYIITTRMSPVEIEHIFSKAVSGIPHVAGINNHMGSRATEDPVLMRRLFGLMKKKGLFFIDSRASKNTVCRRVAGQIGLPFGERDVFLDNTNEKAYIERQFKLLAREAQKNGTALGIGHARALTLQVLKEQSDRLTQEGFLFITVKEFVGMNENQGGRPVPRLRDER